MWLYATIIAITLFALIQIFGKDYIEEKAPSSGQKITILFFMIVIINIIAFLLQSNFKFNTTGGSGSSNEVNFIRNINEDVHIGIPNF